MSPCANISGSNDDLVIKPLQKPHNDVFIWLRCAAAGRRLKHAELSTPLKGANTSVIKWLIVQKPGPHRVRLKSVTTMWKWQRDKYVGRQSRLGGQDEDSVLLKWTVEQSVFRCGSCWCMCVCVWGGSSHHPQLLLVAKAVCLCVKLYLMCPHKLVAEVQIWRTSFLVFTYRQEVSFCCLFCHESSGQWNFCHSADSKRTGQSNDVWKPTALLALHSNTCFLSPWTVVIILFPGFWWANVL